MIDDKENEISVKKKLFESFKKTGILDSLKSQLRSKIVDNLQKPSQKPSQIKDKNELNYRIIVALFTEFLQKYDLSYTTSVFLPECGYGVNILSRQELKKLINIEHISDKLEVPLIEDILGQLMSEGVVAKQKMSSAVQTEALGEGFLSLDEKMKKLESTYMEKFESERLMPFKTMEERMLKYKRECDNRMKQELNSEIARVRETEISVIRLEEASKYRIKLQEFRNDLEKLHNEKVKQLKQRENEVLERCKFKEREIEASSFEHRQKVLKDLEMFRLKEQEVKRTVEIELQAIRFEKEKLLSQDKEFQSKLKDVEIMKSNLTQKLNEDLDRYKKDYERSFYDEKRKYEASFSQLEENERRFNNRKQLNEAIEKDNVLLKEELNALKIDLKSMRNNKDEISLEYQKLKDMFTIAGEAAKRDREIIFTKDNENRTLNEELRLLKNIINDSKQDVLERKNEQGVLMKSLSDQLEDTRDHAKNIQNHYNNEIEVINNRYLKEAQKDKEKYVSVKKELADTKAELEKSREDMKLIEIEKAKEKKQEKKDYEQYIPHISANDLLGGIVIDEEEVYSGDIHERRKMWDMLERENDDIKRDMRILMKGKSMNIQSSPKQREKITREETRKPSSDNDEVEDNKSNESSKTADEKIKNEEEEVKNDEKRLKDEQKKKEKEIKKNNERKKEEEENKKKEEEKKRKLDEDKKIKQEKEKKKEQEAAKKEQEKKEQEKKEKEKKEKEQEKKEQERRKQEENKKKEEEKLKNEEKRKLEESKKEEQKRKEQLNSKLLEDVYDDDFLAESQSSLGDKYEESSEDLF